MKRHPAAILGLGEASEEDEKLFRSEGERGLAQHEIKEKSSPRNTHLSQPSHEYLTIRGDEEKPSVMIAVRKDMTEQFECLWWEKIFDGEYEQDGRVRHAFTRIMICRIRFDEDVGRFGGKEHVVMNVHLHFKTANHDFEGKLEERLD